MKFAVLADIHGNADALAAVLQDMDSLGVSDAVVLGDHFSGPLDAAGTADLLLDRNFTCIAGNHDRYLAEHSPSAMGPSDRVAYDQLPARAQDWLRGLPATVTVFEDVFLCHGTPTSDSRYWLEAVSPDGTPRAATMLEVMREAPETQHSLILCGHTHIPRQVRLDDGTVVLNPGSVGCPAYDDTHPVYHVMQTGSPDASYAIVEKDGSGWTSTFRNIPYDSRRMGALARKHGREDWARALETGWLK